MSKAKLISGLSRDVESQMMTTLAHVLLDPAIIHAEWEAAAGDSKADIAEAEAPLSG